MSGNDPNDNSPWNTSLVSGGSCPTDALPGLYSRSAPHAENKGTPISSEPIQGEGQSIPWWCRRSLQGEAMPHAPTSPGLSRVAIAPPWPPGPAHEEQAPCNSPAWLSGIYHPQGKGFTAGRFPDGSESDAGKATPGQPHLREAGCR